MTGLPRLHATSTVAAPTVGTGDENGADALRRALGEEAAGTGRLVVGVSVDCHQGEGVVGHEITLRTAPTTTRRITVASAPSSAGRGGTTSGSTVPAAHRAVHPVTHPQIEGAHDDERKEAPDQGSRPGRDG